MKKISVALILGAIVVSLAPSAQAEGFKIRKDSLEQVDWFHGKRQVQIIDDDIEVHDLRRRRDSAPYVEIQLEPLDTIEAAGAAGTSTDSTIPAGGLRGRSPKITSVPTWRSTLPQSGFGQSNIPKRLTLRPLPAGYNTGVHAGILAGSSSDPIPAGHPANSITRGGYIRPPVSHYLPYRAAVSGSTHVEQDVSVHGRLIPRGRLLRQQ